ncbi:unnamed protein product [Periconia digitata]|uniref:Uncharacterized protein n=1 Tax=Periconia digitata TaxID=1303443 RepID=A0A9W4UIS9_9PLEO|nr:unnamed protein product [Periconia digitata]
MYIICSILSVFIAKHRRRNKIAGIFQSCSLLGLHLIRSLPEDIVLVHRQSSSFASAVSPLYS